MNTIKIYKTTEKSVELVGTFTRDEYDKFMKQAQSFMLSMSDIYTNLVFIRGAWSVHLWDENKRTTVLTYSAEFLLHDYRF